MKKKSIELLGPLSHFPICSQDDDEDDDMDIPSQRKQGRK